MQSGGVAVVAGLAVVVAGLAVVVAGLAVVVAGLVVVVVMVLPQGKPRLWHRLPPPVA